MMKTSRERQNGGVSNAVSQFTSRKEPLYESMGRLRILEHAVDDKRGAVDEVDYPDRPGEPDCIYYLRTGTCAYGSRCRFNHPPFSGQAIQEACEFPEREGQPECRYFLKTGTCKFGSTCRYHHPQSKNHEPILLNMLGLPMRQEENQCRFYMLNGTCKFGIMCKFDHPQPVPAGNNLPVTPHAAGYGASGLTYLPSSGMSYVGGVSDFSMSKNTYVSNPSMQVPQHYMPVVLPPQGWNRYMGIMSQSPIPTVITNPTSNNQVHVFSASASQHLPDRPDQPECRDFVNNGCCKYGLECKYHHPRDKIPIMPNPFGPLVLPSRPGQTICSDYVQYGFCKYGPACQFDHPWPGYVYNYNMGAPSALLDSPTSPYQWNSPVLLTAETSPSKPSKYPDVPKKADVTKRGQSSTSRDIGDVQLNIRSISSERSIEIHQHDESE